MGWSRLATTLGVAVLVAVFVPAAAAPARPFEPQTTIVRCCFDVEVGASVHETNSYDCVGLRDPSGECPYPDGVQNINVSWVGHELAEYIETGAQHRPSLGILPGGEARVRASFIENGSWLLPPHGDTTHCTRWVDTAAREGDNNPSHGFLELANLVSFRLPAIQISPGRDIDQVFAKTGAGVSYHGTGPSRAAWDGGNQPWVWALKAPARQRFRHGTIFYVRALEAPQDVRHTGTIGSKELHRTRLGGSADAIFKYIPRGQLAARIRFYRSHWPITSKAFRELEGCG